MKSVITVVLIIASKGFQPIEYQNTKKALENAGITVHTASTKLGEAIAADGTKAPVDLTIKHVIQADYDGIVFIGGPGVLDDLDNETSYELIRNTVKNSILLAAICIAPRILAKAGVLTGKKATGWDDDNELADIFKTYGVTYLNEDVVVDNLLVTATGPAAATEFGKTVAKIAKR
jgi:protease I